LFPTGEPLLHALLAEPDVPTEADVRDFTSTSRVIYPRAANLQHLGNVFGCEQSARPVDQRHRPRLAAFEATDDSQHAGLSLPLVVVGGQR
jgi:hypothetical protein